jgi:hemerythrin-like domain-containing protein
MNVTDNLLQDHEEIAAMLQVVTACAGRLQEGHYVDPPMLQGLDRFLQQFVGECYFRKQRAVFLPFVREVLPEESARTHEIAGLRALCLGPMRNFHLVIEHALAGAIEPLVRDFASTSAVCVERVTAHLKAERPLLERVRRLQDVNHAALLDRCAGMERESLGATGREWYTQLVIDYTDIARSWASWPATSAAPTIDSGHPSPGAAPVDHPR